MTIIKTLTQLRAGQRPTSGLLHNCRLHAFGSEAYGVEAIVERFRTMPYAVAGGDAVVVVTAATNVALFAGAGAIFADVHGNNIGRLWRLGLGTPVLPEAGVSVVFDVDLMQARGNQFFAASDHPGLSPDGAQTVVNIGCALAVEDAGLRARAFAIRAFGTKQEGAALFVLHRLSSDTVRTSGFVHVAARWINDDVTLVRDAAGDAAVAATPWTPRIGFCE